MSRFLLYLGIILVCSGVGTGIGILLLIFYFWNDIKKSLRNFEVTSRTNSLEKILIQIITVKIPPRK